MKRKFQLLGLTLSLLMLLVLPVVPGIQLKADAAAALVTQNEAVNWAKNQVGKTYNIDGIYGSQCSDFGSAYINWLISGSTALNKPFTTYNGYKYFDLNYPDGWQKIRNYPELIPQPGDILVWGTSFGGGYGHVAVAIEGCTINTIKCIEQNGMANGGNGSPVQYATYNYNGFTGVVRPQWKSQVFPSKPNAKASKSVYRENEMITISWDKCSNVNWFDVEIVNTETGALVYSRNSNNTNAEMTFLTTTLGIGDYRAKITSVNSYGGTIQATPSDYVWFSVKPNTYTNSIGHWLFGFKNGEGNNGDKNAFNLAYTSFIAQYNSSYIIDKSWAVKLPNGVELRNNIATPSIDGTWKEYPFKTLVTQKASNMLFEYYYDLITYKITYDLAGGTNNSANPATYNVFYGVNLKNPTRTGYTFAGWYNGSTKVTGINEGKNATFANADVLYSELAKRQTGDIKLTAKWTPNTYTVKYNANGGSGTMANSSHTYGTAKALNSNAFTRTGYIFQGWSTSAFATSATYTDKQSVNNLNATNGATVNLYAVWSPKGVVLKMNSEYAYSDGKVKHTTQYATGYAKMKNIYGTMMIPLRYVAEVNGFAVDYDAASNKTKIINSATGEYLLVSPGSAVVEKYSSFGARVSETTAPQPFVVDDGVTMGPIRFVCEALGLHVEYKWISDSEQYVTVTSDKISNEQVNVLLSKAIELGL